VLTLALLTGSAYGSLTFWLGLLGLGPQAPQAPQVVSIVDPNAALVSGCAVGIPTCNAG